MYGSLDGKPNNAPGGLDSLQGDMGTISRSSGGGTGNTTGGGNNNNSGGGGGDNRREQYSVARTTTPISQPVSLPSNAGNDSPYIMSGGERFAELAYITPREKKILLDGSIVTGKLTG